MTYFFLKEKVSKKNFKLVLLGIPYRTQFKVLLLLFVQEKKHYRITRPYCRASRSRTSGSSMAVPS